MTKKHTLPSKCPKSGHEERKGRERTRVRKKRRTGVTFLPRRVFWADTRREGEYPDLLKEEKSACK